MDFMSDVLMTGRKVRVLNIMDDYTRESLSAHADYSLPGNAVVQVLEQIAEERELPAQIRVDNGPEFLSKECLHRTFKQNIQRRRPGCLSI